MLLLLGPLNGAVQAVRVRRDADDDGAEAADPYRAYDGQSLFKVSACTQSQVDAVSEGLANSSCRFLSEPGALTLPRSGHCAQGLAVCGEDLRRASPGAELLAEGTAGNYFRERGAGRVRRFPPGSLSMRLGERAFYEAFRSYEDIVERLRGLVELSNGTAELLLLSPRTHEKRQIHAVRLRGAGWQPGSPRALFTYTLHAREWISSMAGVYAVERAVEMATADSSFLRSVEVVFVPVSNPDGFKYSAERERYWRKNRRPQRADCMGVDLNRNFNFEWARGEGSADSGGFRGFGGSRAEPPRECQDVYSGPEPASEPETQALQNLIKEAPLTVSIDFHSCGGYILGPWSYTTTPHHRIKEIYELGSQFRTAIQDWEGVDYQFCTGNTCLYPVPGNAADYGTNTGALSFTIEMRPAVREIVGMHDLSPPHDQILPNAQENFQAVLAAVTFARKSLA